MMAKTLYHLSLYVNRISRQISDQSAKYVKAAGREVLKSLAKETPVDTSLAVSNWIVSVGTPTVKVNPPHVPGKYGSTASASRAITLSYGRKVINTYKSRKGLFISNLLDYVVELDNGGIKPAKRPNNNWSAGFVQRAVMRGRLAVPKVKLILK